MLRDEDNKYCFDCDAKGFFLNNNLSDFSVAKNCIYI
jgi:hypothetical protein